MNLVYLIFGKRVTYHYEAMFSIYSFLHTTKSIKKIFIYTDAPEFYRHISDKINLRIVDEKQLEEWKGAYGFFWRVKIKAVEDVILNNPGEDLVYLDSDTFVYASSQQFEDSLQEGKAFMHKQEALLSNSPSHTQTVMWRQMRGKTFEGITIHKNHVMWNAGLIAIPSEKQKEAIDFALRLCDSMCAAGVTPRLIEQFAFSLALQETYPMLPADDFVGHYWGNKNEWDSVIQDYIVQSHLQNLSIEEEIENLAGFDFRKIPVIKKKRTMYKRLNSLLIKCLPDREVFIRKN